MAIDKDAIKKSTPKKTNEVTQILERGKTKNPQTTASEEEQAQRVAEHSTQGRKGCKAPKISFATTPENLDFVSVMAKLSGRSVARYMNFLIEDYRKNHPGIYERALELMKEAGLLEVEE